MKEEQTLSGWTEKRISERERKREGSRELRPLQKGESEKDERDETVGGGRYEGEKDEGHEGRAIFLKNIPQTVAREGRGRRDATLRTAAGNCRQPGREDTRRRDDVGM